MAKIRHVFPGGNSCYGFYSFYDQIVSGEVSSKIILKGGPGVGKSTFMKKIAQDLSARSFDVEYHWCSSDNQSLDAVVGGNRQVCVLDGTAPHVVDPRYPGAVDYIINLGEYWDAKLIAANRGSITALTDQISLCFRRAYNRLAEAKLAVEEWETYIKEATDIQAVNRNILALTEDFLHSAVKNNVAPRHLFAAAITPEGVVSRADTLIERDYSITAVKGSPGSGCQDLLLHAEHSLRLAGVYAEIYHCPFNPAHIDMILIPENKTVLINLSAHIVDYEKVLPASKFKRFLDFDQFLDQSLLSPHAKVIAAARDRLNNGIQNSVAFISTAKKYHDELEKNYIPAMDFEAISALQKEISERLISCLE